MRSKALFLTLALGGAFVGGVTYSALNTTNTDGSAAAPFAASADAGSCPMMSGGCGMSSGDGALAAAPSAAQLAAFDAALDGKPAAMAATTPAAETSFAAERDATFSPSTATAASAPLADSCPAVPGCCMEE